ncbi:MAG: ABC transporter ATP-binding protein [Bacteroidota bacterium]
MDSEASLILEATDVFKSYPAQDNGDRLVVLDGVSFALPSHHISSIIGSSGSGKSTLLHILGGLDQADSGQVRVLDQTLTDLPDEQRARFRNQSIGFVFQFHHLLPEFTALENVAMPAYIQGVSKNEAEERALDLMSYFGVAERKNHRPTQLSGGEQQRVSLARALINRPKIILADEPTGNLDADNTKKVLDLLFQLRDEYDVSMILVTHEKEIAERADRIYTLENGKLH